MRKREKKKFSPVFVPRQPGQENTKKNSKKIQKIKKHHCLIFFIPNWDKIGRESGKKILVSNSVPTQPAQKNSKKK